MAHPTTVARLIGWSVFSGMAWINFLRAEIYTAHSSKLAGAFVKTILPLRHRCGRCGSAYQGDGPQVFLLFLIMRCPPTVRLLIVLTLPPSYRCPLDRLPASRLLLPRSALERSDFVRWHFW